MSADIFTSAYITNDVAESPVAISDSESGGDSESGNRLLRNARTRFKWPPGLDDYFPYDIDHHLNKTTEADNYSTDVTDDDGSKVHRTDFLQEGGAYTSEADAPGDRREARGQSPHQVNAPAQQPTLAASAVPKRSDLGDGLCNDHDRMISPNMYASGGGPAASQAIGHLEPLSVAEQDYSDQEWEAREILGNEVVNGVVHYWVDWNPTLMPEYALGNAWTLVEAFWTKKQSQHKTIQQRTGKRRRCCPRKQNRC